MAGHWVWIMSFLPLSACNCSSAFDPQSIVFEPSMLDFGTIPAGTMRDLSLAVTNTGSGDIRIVRFEIADDVVHAFSLLGTPPATLASGVKNTVNVRFSPAAGVAGDTFPGSVSVAVAGYEMTPLKATLAGQTARAEIVDGGMADSGGAAMDASSPDSGCSAPPPPPVTFSDGDFPPASWSATVFYVHGGASQDAYRSGLGGSPGAFRHMVHHLPGPSNIGVSHLFMGATYDPRVQGPIDHLDYSEDHIQYNPPFQGAAVGALFTLMQGGVLFEALVNGGVFTETTWTTVHVPGLRASDFVPSDASNQRPDFSASGQPITFGYARSNTNDNATGEFDIDHGIDNWSVTVVPACR